MAHLLRSCPMDQLWLGEVQTKGVTLQRSKISSKVSRKSNPLAVHLPPSWRIDQLLPGGVRQMAETALQSMISWGMCWKLQPQREPSPPSLQMDRWLPGAIQEVVVIALASRTCSGTCSGTGGFNIPSPKMGWCQLMRNFGDGPTPDYLWHFFGTAMSPLKLLQHRATYRPRRTTKLNGKRPFPYWCLVGNEGMIHNNYQL